MVCVCVCGLRARARACVCVNFGGGNLLILKNGVGVWRRGRFLKRDGRWVAERRGEGWHFSYLTFSRFTILKFTNYFTLCKIVLCI